MPEPAPTSPSTQPKERPFAAFQVSVMPKEFRGKEGLERPFYAPRPVVAPASQNVGTGRDPSTPVTPTKDIVTPQTARDQKLTPPPARVRHRTALWLAIGGVLVLIILGIVAWAVIGSVEPETPPDRVAPPPVVIPEPAPTPTPVPKPEPEPEPESEDPLSSLPLPGQDSDSDGLTDIEEVLYGTDPNRPDTDLDTYLDGNEVNHLYHPNALAPQTLLDTGAVVVVQPDGYQLYGLTRWQRSVNTSTKVVLMTAPTLESFQVVPSLIGPTETLNQWYARQVPAAVPEPLTAFRTKQGFVGAWTPDRLTAYVRFNDETVLIFTYNLGSATRIQYRQSFEMLINSLRAVE